MNLTNAFDVSNVLVFVAGVRMPVNSVSVTSAFNAFPACTVTMPPDSRLFGIGRLDRVPFHIFVENVFCQKEEEYIMLFEGEVASFGYSSTSAGREMVLNGKSNMCFLNDMDLKVLVGLDDFSAAMVSGADTTTAFTAGGISYPMSLVMSGVGKVAADNLIQYPYGFISNVAEFLANTITQPVPNSKVFNFFKEYAKRLKFSQRFSPVPYFDDAKAPWGTSGFPILAGVQRETAVQHLNGAMSNGPNIRSLYSILDYIATRMEYELGVFASPTLVSGRLNTMALKPIFYEAMPPRCNIMFRSLCSSIRTNEQVYQVPTRIRVKDLSGTVNQMSHGKKSALVQFGINDYYPKETPAGSGNLKYDPFAEELLDSEEYTGPYTYETTPPDWMSYIDPKAVGEESLQSYKENIMRHMLLLKRYEGRQLNCESGFNPFHTPGFPGAVFDTDDAGFTFLGQVMSVTHNINKQNAVTSVSMSFVRTLAEENANPLPNSLEMIDNVTKRDSTAMSLIYQTQIGSLAVPFSDIGKLFGLAYNDDPGAAYAFNQRSIVTLDEFMSFLGGDHTIQTRTTQGRHMPHILAGANFDDRNDDEIIQVLKEISEESLSGSIYA